MAISNIRGFNGLSPALLDASKVSSNKISMIPFADFLSTALNKTNELLIQSEKLSNEFAAGKADNIHQVLIAGEKANIALQFTVQIRNKILDAYNEIMRMQI